MNEADFYTPGWVDEPAGVELVALEQPAPFWGLTPAAAVPMESLGKGPGGSIPEPCPGQGGQLRFFRVLYGRRGHGSR